MEATGVYWKPVYYLLEDDFELWLVNAQHVKDVPGRKTDVQADALTLAPSPCLAFPLSGILSGRGKTMGAVDPCEGRGGSTSVGDEVAGWTPPPFFKLKRTMLAIAGALASINVWTGGPVFALWVGSQFQGWIDSRAPGTGISLEGVFAVIVVLAAVETALVLLMTRVSDAYDKLMGRPQKGHRRTSPWLRSLGGERQELERDKYGVSAVERIGMVSVVACVLAFEAWLFFAPRSALPY